jgi:hypothetical protein
MAREIKQPGGGKSHARRMSGAHRKTAKPKSTRNKSTRKWSAKVMARSDALDLEKGAFKKRSAKQIAASLKRSADHSRRRKAGPFQSAMSMLNFYINRGGRGLSAERKKTLERAKTELRRLYGRA